MRNPPARPAAALRSAVLAAALLALAAASAAGKIRVVALFKDRAVLEVDGARRVLSAGDTSAEGVTLVSANSEEAVIEVGGKRRALGIGTHIGSSFEGPKLATVRIFPSGANMYTVEGSVNGAPIRFLVDTGATSIAINRDEARRLGIDYLADGEPALASTASGITKTWRVKLRSVKIGAIELRDVQAAVVDGEHPALALLGMSFLGQLDMRRDGDVLELRKKY